MQGRSYVLLNSLIFQFLLMWLLITNQTTVTVVVFLCQLASYLTLHAEQLYS